MNRDERMRALWVACPLCDAHAGVDCIDFAGGKVRVHMKRVRAAAAAGALSKEVVDREAHRRR